MLVHICGSVVTVVNTQFSWSVCFYVYIYYVPGGGPCLPSWYCAIMGGWRQDWRQFAGIDHAFLLFSMGWGNHLKHINWLTIIWRFNVLTQQHVFAGGTGMWHGGAYTHTFIYTRKRSPFVLISHVYTRTKQDRTRNETGTLYLSPFDTPKKSNKNNGRKKVFAKRFSFRQSPNIRSGRRTATADNPADDTAS